LIGFVRRASYVDFRASISAEAIVMSNDTAAYVAGWLKKLRDDRRLRRHAAAQARHTADYILRAPHTV
jgi:antirestriction protein ArdC